MTGIKNCPFCGGEMSVKSNKDWHQLHGTHAVDCVFDDDAALIVPATDDQMLSMIKSWNTRATPPEVVALVAAAKSILKNMKLNHGKGLRLGHIIRLHEALDAMEVKP